MPESVICKAFKNRARWTWDEINARLDDGTIDENNITNENLANIKKHGGGRVFVHKFNQVVEGRVGADWEWFFLGRAGYLHCRIQAKIIDRALGYPHLRRSAAAISGLPGAGQVDVLIRDAHAVGAVPLYCFYNHWPPGSGLAPTWSCRCVSTEHPLFGCAIVDAYTVKRLIDAGGGIGAADLMAHSFPWHCLVCCSDRTITTASPRAGFSVRAQTFLSGWLERQDVPRQNIRPVRFREMERLPQYVKAIISDERMAEEQTAPPAPYVLTILDTAKR